MVFIDEAIFNSTSTRGKYWSPAGKPFQQDVKFSFDQRAVAAVGAISLRLGKISLMTFERSLNSNDFIKFLEHL